MAPINFYWGRGTGEQFGAASMYTNVTSRLDRSIFDVIEVPCIAEIRPIGTRTIQESMDSLTAWMDAHKDHKKPWMGGGYDRWSTFSDTFGNYNHSTAAAKPNAAGGTHGPYTVTASEAAYYSAMMVSFVP